MKYTLFFRKESIIFVTTLESDPTIKCFTKCLGFFMVLLLKAEKSSFSSIKKNR